MKTIKHIYKLGDSYAVTIPIKIIRKLGLKEGDYVMLDIQKVFNELGGKK